MHLWVFRFISRPLKAMPVVVCRNKFPLNRIHWKNCTSLFLSRDGKSGGVVLSFASVAAAHQLPFLDVWDVCLAYLHCDMEYRSLNKVGVSVVADGIVQRISDGALACSTGTRTQCLCY